VLGAPTLFIGNDFSDVAGSAPPVKGPSLSTDVPVLSVDGLKLPTEFAGFPPHAVSDFASAVDSLVGDCIEQLQVPDSVVLLVEVDMVDLEAIGDRSVMALPFDDVVHDSPSSFSIPNGVSVVSLRGGISESRRVL
jgi:hypothetical protein